MIKATSQQRGKSGGSQQQGDIRGSTLAPAATAANPSARNACQGTNPPSRRPQSVLRGPSRGEEATKKLLAIRSVQKANSPRLLGIRRIPPAGTGAALARLSARNRCCSQRPTNSRRTVQHSKLSKQFEACCLALCCRQDSQSLTSAGS